MRHPTQLSTSDVVWPNIRILVFSLDDAFRFLVRQTFRKLNVREVLSTSVSADATPMMVQSPDMGLVDMDGSSDGDGDGSQALAFLQRVRAANPHMPVLMVVRKDDRALVDKALPLGIEGVVPKPVSGHELIHRVGEALKSPMRIAMPKAAAPRPAIILSAAPPVAAAQAAADSAAVKAELAALTARLGQMAGDGADQTLPSDVVPMKNPGGDGGGGGVTAPAPAKVRGGSSYTAPARPAATITGGGGGGRSGGNWGADDVAPVKLSGGKLAHDDVLETKNPAASGGTLAEDEVVKTKKTKRDLLVEALPEALRPKELDEAARRKAERDRALWQEELAKMGRKKRKGKDVAGLDVDGMVAAHVLWLTSQGAEGKRAAFNKMELAGGDLARVVLANASFREADLSDCALAEARLDGADFRYASLNAADLTGANLGVAHLRHANMRLANLAGANLRGADLSGAALSGAKLAGADFKSATMVGTNLKEVDLSKVENLSQGQIDKAECDMKTKLPPGILRPPQKEDV